MSSRNEELEREKKRIREAISTLRRNPFQYIVGGQVVYQYQSEHADFEFINVLHLYLQEQLVKLSESCKWN